jgi:hypothetical protein
MMVYYLLCRSKNAEQEVGEMAITKKQLIVDLDKYFEMGNMMSALTVISNFLSQERSKRARRLRKKLPLFLEAIEEDREEVKRVLKKWKKDSPFKMIEFVNYLEKFEEMEEEEKEELTGKLQEVVQEPVG